MNVECAASEDDEYIHERECVYIRLGPRRKEKRRAMEILKVATEMCISLFLIRFFFFFSDKLHSSNSHNKNKNE